MVTMNELWRASERIGGFMEFRGMRPSLDVVVVENGWIVSDRSDDLIGQNAEVHVFTDPVQLGDFIAEWGKGRQKVKADDRPMNAEDGN